MPEQESQSTEEQGVRHVEDAKQELRSAIEGSEETIATASTVFPMTLFPDTVTIDRTKLTVTHRRAFGAAEVTSIRVEDILNVTANVGPIFGSLRIVSRVFSDDKPLTLDYMWKQDAQRMKRILQGYIIAMQREIDVSPIKSKELADMLDKLGKDDHKQ